MHFSFYVTICTYNFMVRYTRNGPDVTIYKSLEILNARIPNHIMVSMILLIKISL